VRDRQRARQGDCNARLTAAQIALCAFTGAGEALLRDAARRMALSARGYHRVLKVARTIADLAGVDALDAAHVAEALAYRSFDADPGAT
jgi:magnesium chelatase family protein